MSTPKFQHYVPRFYLVRFAHADGRLCVFDKTNGRTFWTRPENIAGQNHFYNLPELEELGGVRFLMETQFADLEGQAHQIIACWLRQLGNQGRMEIPAPNREIMALFLTLQLLRTAEYRTLLLQFTQRLQKDGELNKSYDAEADVQALHGAMLWDEKLIGEIRAKLADCIWVFGFNDSSHAFYTSDHPALIKTSDSKGWLLGPRVFEPGMYLVLPLSPQWILYCKDRKHWKKLERFENQKSPVTFTPNMVDHENSGQVGSSTRFIFSNSADFSFAKKYCKLAPAVTDSGRDRFIAPPPLDGETPFDQQEPTA